MLIPLLLSIGAAIDYARAANLKYRLRSNLDAALIAGIKKIGNLDQDELKQFITNWFAENAIGNDYTLDNDDISIDFANTEISASVSSNSPTSFMKIANIDSIPVKATSTVVGPSTSYFNIYLVLDLSESMLLPSTTAGQTTMRSKTGCEFACHEESISVSTTKTCYDWRGRSYSCNTTTNYNSRFDYARAAGIELREDVLKDAAQGVVDRVEEADISGSHIKIGLYKLTSSLSESLSPTTDKDLVRSTLSSSSALNPSSKQDGTFFQSGLSTLATLAGDNGSGETSADPMKLVLLVTDGVNSYRDYVQASSWSCSNYRYEGTTYSGVNCPMKSVSYGVEPLHPSWCDAVKNKNVTFAVLYTRYLAIPKDWGWVGTLGQSITSSQWYRDGYSLESGTDGSTIRLDYLPIALKSCATSSEYYAAASTPDEITQGLSALLDQYLSSVRLTQ